MSISEQKEVSQYQPNSVLMRPNTDRMIVRTKFDLEESNLS